jgi:hypothetical protein
MVLFLIFNYSIQGYIKQRDHQQHNISNWQNYKKLLNNSTYYIPINPGYNWAISRNTKLMDDTIFDPINSNASIYSIMIIQPPPALFALKLWNEKGQEISAVRMDDSKSEIAYFVLASNEKISKIDFYNANASKIDLERKKLRFVVVGKENNLNE